MRIQQKYNIGDMATLATLNLTKNTQHEHKFKVNAKHKNKSTITGLKLLTIEQIMMKV